jgi:hypothetical protein
MAFSGCCALELLGGTFPSAMALGPRSQPVLSLAQGWPVGAFAEVSTAAVQHPGKGELGTSLCGWHHGSCPSACGGSQGENPEGEALGRSQGGFSTKVHLRAEGGGKLITLVLTPGQRHEAPIFPQLMAQGQTQAEAALGSGRQGL